MWGVQTWDENGKPNNYGFVPVTVIGRIELAFEQLSATETFTVPPGFKLDYIHAVKSSAYTNKRRQIKISGGTVSVSEGAVTNFGIGTDSAQPAVLIIYLRRIA